MSFGPSESLDVKLYYTGDEARALFQRLSESDLNAYFIIELFDLCYLTSYTGLFLLGLRQMYPRQAGAIALPLIVGASDLIETLAVIGVLKFSVSQTIFDWLGVFTFLKWTLGAIVVLLLLVKALLKSR